MKKKIIYGLGVLSLVIITVIATSYITKNTVEANAQTMGIPQSMQKKTAATNTALPWQDPKSAPVSATNNMPWKTQQAAQPCNDNNVVGTLLGGVAGGLIGHGLGKGSGKTVATIGGAAGGAYLGNQMIPTQGVACK